MRIVALIPKKFQSQSIFFNYGGGGVGRGGGGGRGGERGGGKGGGGERGGGGKRR